MLGPILLALALTACDAPRGEQFVDLAARIGADSVTVSEVDARVQMEEPEFWQTLYDARRRALATIVEERLLTAEAKRQGISVDSLVTREIAAASSPVDSNSVSAYYENNRQHMGGHSLSDVQDQLRDYLTASAAREARTRYVAELRPHAGVDVLLELPSRQVEVGADEPSRGPLDAPVVIVEYSDFQCPYCRQAQPTLDQVAATYGDRVQLVYRDFPLAMHANAHRAAQAAQCAHEQGAFWPYHDILFQNIRRLGEQDLRRHAKAARLDTSAFDECLSSGRYFAAVDADLARGEAHGVSGTPAFFINGRFLSGAQPFAAFRDIIDDELTQAGLATP